MALLSLVLALSLAQAPPPAAAPPDVRARVLSMLGAIDRPVSAEAFRKLGPEGEAALVDVALSDELAPWRARALEVLAGLGSARAEEVHLAVARDAAAPAAVRRAALRGLGTILSPATAAEALRPILSGDPESSVRGAAAAALARAAPADGCAAVRRQVAREPAGTRVAFRRAVEACDRAR